MEVENNIKNTISKTMLLEKENLSSSKDESSKNFKSFDLDFTFSGENLGTDTD